tara:strand:+ start:659 stop:976 length:318 start_codon:yes stop_codon:yes gene_type:complete
MRNKPLPGLYKSSPLKNSSKVRTDSTTTYDPTTLKVDSTPVGHYLGTKAGGFGFGAAIKAGNTPSSMIKGIADDMATKTVVKQNRALSDKSNPGSGNKIMIMPGE